MELNYIVKAETIPPKQIIAHKHGMSERWQTVA